MQAVYVMRIIPSIKEVSDLVVDRVTVLWATVTWHFYSWVISLVLMSPTNPGKGKGIVTQQRKKKKKKT